MPLVQDAPRAALALVGIAAAGLAGCGGGGGGGGQPQQAVGPRLGVELRLADCADWKRAGPGQRQDLLEQLRNFAGGPVGTSRLHGATLPQDQAYNLFENSCREPFARRFRLYRLYTRAAAFRHR